MLHLLLDQFFHRTSGNNSPGNFTQNVPNRPLRNLVNIPDYDSRQTFDETPDDFDFLDCFVTRGGGALALAEHEVCALRFIPLVLLFVALVIVSSVTLRVRGLSPNNSSMSE